MFIRNSLSVFALLILLLCTGCQGDATPTIPAATATAPPTAAPTSPPPAAPTEAPAPLPDGPTIPVPRGGPATIDGTLSLGEWEGARVEIFADGSELLLMHSDGYLYLGIRSNTPEMIVGNIHLYRGIDKSLERGLVRGEEIAILHSSAALGTAVYGRGGDNWQQTQAFEWRCRQTGNSEAAQAERTEFLEQERWLAGNARMGTPNELEYQIEVIGDSQRLAVNFLRASDPDHKIPWPTDLDDDCIKPTPGGLPAEMHFTPEEWGTLTLTP